MQCETCIRFAKRMRCPAFVLKTSMSADSKRGCMGICRDEVECEAFLYDEHTQECQLFLDEVDTTAEPCPVNRRIYLN